MLAFLTLLYKPSALQEYSLVNTNRNENNWISAVNRLPLYQ